MAEEEERYTFQEATEKLNISKSTLLNWIARAGLREAVDRQVLESDARVHYLTKSQQEYLARTHQIRLHKTPNDLTEIYDRLERVERAVERLTEIVEKADRPLKDTLYARGVQGTWAEWFSILDSLNREEQIMALKQVREWIEDQRRETEGEE